jgi:hypothetical protein
MTEIEERSDRRNLMLRVFWICVSAAFLVFVPAIDSSAGESGKMKTQIRADGHSTEENRCRDAAVLDEQPLKGEVLLAITSAW